MKNTCLAAITACAISVPTAHAQQAPFGDSAIQPSKGVLAVQQLATYTSYGEDPSGTRHDLYDLRLETNIVYGLEGDTALQFRIPTIARSWENSTGTNNDDFGLGDPSVALRWRFWQNDSTAVNTQRAVLIVGTELPSGDAEFSSRSVDPFIGIALSTIEGRWAWNTSAKFKVNTSGEGTASRITPGDFADEAFYLDASALYRLSPEEWGPDTDVSMYAILELNSLFETGGDAEVMLAPGFLWEANTWAWELSVQLPIVEDVNNRLEREWSVRGGIRLLF